MTQQTNNSGISIPGAIIIAGIIIAAAVLIAFAGKGSQTLTQNDQGQAPTQGISIAQAAENTGINMDTFEACFNDGATLGKVDRDANNAIDTGGRGTPHNIIITPEGNAIAVSGALPLAQWNAILDDLQSDNPQAEFSEEDLANNVLPVSAEDHIRGNVNAEYTIIEYSDANCGFCQQLHGTLETLVEDRDDVRWVYRHFPILAESSQEIALASECVAEQEGSDGFWQFIDAIMEA